MADGDEAPVADGDGSAMADGDRSSVDDDDGSAMADGDRSSVDDCDSFPDAHRPAVGWLECWALATFAVVTLGVVLVLLGHLQDALGRLLSDLGTAPGFLLFGYLWALSVVGVRWALADGGIRGLRAAGAGHLLGRGAGAGAFVGGGFVLGLLLAVLGGALLTGQFPIVGLAIYGGIGTAIGATVGGTVGVAFAAVAAGFSVASDALVGRPAED